MGNAKSSRRCTRGSSDSGSSEEDDAPAVRALTMPGPKTPRKGVNNKPTDKKVNAVVPPKPTGNSSPGGGSKKKKNPRLVSDSTVQERRADPQLTKKVANSKSTDKKVVNNKSMDKKVDDIVPPKPMQKSSASGSSQKNPPLVGDSVVHERQADPQLTKKVVNNKSADKKVVNNKSTDKKVDDIAPPKPMEKSSTGVSSQKNPPLVGDSAVHERQADPQLTKKVVNSKSTDKKVINNKFTDKKVDDIVPPKPMEKSSASGSNQKNPPHVGDSAVHERQADPQLTKKVVNSKSTDKKVVNNKSTDKKVDNIVPPKPMKKSSASGSSQKNPSLIGDSAVHEQQADQQLTKKVINSKSTDKKVDDIVPPKPMEKSSASGSSEKNPPLIGDSAVSQADLLQLTDAPPKSSRKRDSKATDKKVDTVVPPKPMEKSSAGESCEKTGSRVVDVSAVQDPQLEAVLAEMQRHHHCHCQYVGHGTAAALAENNHHHHQQQPVLGAADGAEQCPSSSYYKGVMAVDLVPTEASEEVRVLATADPVRRHKPTKKDPSLVDAPALQADPQLEAVLANMQEQALQADAQLEAVLANMQRQAPPPHHRQ
ncbi:hypothetical protein VPH35_107074 [Triticum aestivum]